MSKNNQIIAVSPPMFLNKKNNKEKIILSGHRCSECHGTGYHLRGEPPKGRTFPCSLCGGTGTLTAEIVITWTQGKAKR